MKEQIRETFIELKVVGQRCAMNLEEKREKDRKLIQYLKSLIENEVVTDFEDIGFCYWNISDNYAMIRDGHAEMLNHKNFYSHVHKIDPCYLFWLICDATQRLTLEKDGYSDFWWALYKEALEQNRDGDQYFAEFNAHRAAV